MFRHRSAVGRAQGTITRRTARRVLTALTATTVALGLLPLAAPSAQAATYTITGRVTGLNASGTVVGVGDAGLWIEDLDRQDAGSITWNSDGTYTATFASPGPYKIQAGCWGDMTCASQWGIEYYADKGDFYLLRYGDYLVAMNCSAKKSAGFDVPADFAGAAELTRPDAGPATPGKRLAPPRSTLVLHRRFPSVPSP